MNTSKYKQTTLEQYKNWNRTRGTHTQQATKEPEPPQYPKTQHESPETIEYRHPPIQSVTFNTRGMHNTILALQSIMNTQQKPTIIHITGAKHSHIKAIWREVLKDYKLTHTYPILDPTTNRRSGGTILAARRDTYKEVTAIPTSPNIGDYISAATLTP